MYYVAIWFVAATRAVLVEPIAEDREVLLNCLGPPGSAPRSGSILDNNRFSKGCPWRGVLNFEA
ncbi:hypothetical protein FA13DRAFT_1405234 [Coprinellus micaceus]|uniref:Uncharacterized protein n=1 Tax=Coprinellus micaceus TaxID=71717 RepID=A0A4Y7SP47_COPMI|nr:hypothetical protein FA13DRAFT_1405234 [Coprinellus micaceus]